jgi:hypothetical protein
MTRTEHYEKLARMRADHYQKINRANNTEWFDIYQEGLENTALLDEYEDYLYDIEEAKRKGDMPR